MNGKALAPCEHEGAELFPPVSKNEGYPPREALKFYAVPLDLLVNGTNRVEIKKVEKGKASCQFRSLDIALYR